MVLVIRTIKNERSYSEGFTADKCGMCGRTLAADKKHKSYVSNGVVASLLCDVCSQHGVLQNHLGPEE